MASRPRSAPRGAALAGAALVLVATLLPVREPPGPPGCFACGATAAADAIANVVLFVPLGMALVGMGLRRRSALLTGVALSACVELLQAAFVQGRDGSLADILANATGAVAGALVAFHAAPLVWPRHPRRAATVLVLAILSVIVTTGVAARVSLPASAWWGQWTARFARLAWYDGRVTAATIAGMPLPSRRMSDSRAVRAALLRGETLMVRFVAGSRPGRTAPIFSVADEDQRAILLLGASGTDLELRIRRKAGDLRLIQPRIVARRALRHLSPGDTAAFALWRDGAAWCVAVDGRSRCAVGLSAAGGWRLLVGRGGHPALGVAGDLLWIAGLLALGAFWLPAGGRVLLGVVVLVAACGILPAVVGLDATALPSWLGGCVGVAAGIVARRYVGESCVREP